MHGIVGALVMSEKKLSVSIVIPNRNGAKLLEKYLPGVIQAAKGTEIIVVDDGSSDNSVVLLREKFSEVLIVGKRKHEGFASTANAGAVAAHGDIVVLLNSDVEPEANFLEALVPHFKDGSVFAVGCLEKSHEDGHVVVRGRGEASWIRGFYIHKRGEVDKATTAWVSGGSAAFRKTTWVRLGGMDTLYNPFYWEDIDLSYRALKAGYRIVFEKRSIVHHYHESGIIKQEYSPQYVKLVAYRNQFIFVWKNLSDPGMWMAHCIWTPVKLLKALLTLDFPMVAGYLSALLCLPWILAARLHSMRFSKKKDRDIMLR